MLNKSNWNQEVPNQIRSYCSSILFYLYIFISSIIFGQSIHLFTTRSTVSSDAWSGTLIWLELHSIQPNYITTLNWIVNPRGGWSICIPSSHCCPRAAKIQRLRLLLPDGWLHLLSQVIDMEYLDLIMGRPTWRTRSVQKIPNRPNLTISMCCVDGAEICGPP